MTALAEAAVAGIETQRQHLWIKQAAGSERARVARFLASLPRSIAMPLPAILARLDTPALRTLTGYASPLVYVAECDEFTEVARLVGWVERDPRGVGRWPLRLILLTGFAPPLKADILDDAEILVQRVTL